MFNKAEESAVAAGVIDDTVLPQARQRHAHERLTTRLSAATRLVIYAACLSWRLEFGCCIGSISCSIRQNALAGATAGVSNWRVEP